MSSSAIFHVVFLVLILLGAGAFRVVLRRDPDTVVARMVVFGLLAKLVGSVARFTVMADLYGGRGDFNRYHENGAELAGQIRSGSLPDQARETGTPFMDFIAGVFYTVAPSQLWVGFFAFALLSFIGALLFLQAFRLALPDGNHRLYAALVFFTPTMVFWPSSLGKEAWLVFTLGVAAYGAARVLRGRPWGYLVVLLGGAGAFVVRPHMGALFALAFAGAFLLRFRDTSVRTKALGWGLGAIIIGLGAGFAVANFGDELPQDESVEGMQADQILAETARRTTQGGSEYDSRPVRSIGDLGHALITVPFRPFPTEGHNWQAQLAGLEGVVLLAILLLTLPRVASLPRLVLRRPYVAMATAYSLGFVIAFSNVGNFGILTRQRAQLLPFLFVLLALPAVQERRLRKRGSSAPVLMPISLEAQSDLEDAQVPHPLGTAYAAATGQASKDPGEYWDLIIDLPPGVLRSDPRGSTPPGVNGHP